MKTLELELHPYCAILPEMPRDEFRQLVGSIREHGLRHAIKVDDENRIVDGRHRYRACIELGYEPRIEVLHLEGEQLIDWIIDTNVARRHLTPSQRAIVDQKFVAELQRIRDGDGRKRASSSIAREVAERTGTPERSIKRAARIAQADDALAEEVRDGKKTLHAAEKELQKRESAKGPIGPLAENATQEAPEPPKDAEGNAIPTRLVETFVEGAKIAARIRKAISDAANELESCAKLDCVVVARNILDQMPQIKLGVPALVCPKCSGAGLIPSKTEGVGTGCTWCASRGWLPEHKARGTKR